MGRSHSFPVPAFYCLTKFATPAVTAPIASRTLGSTHPTLALLLRGIMSHAVDTCVYLHLSQCCVSSAAHAHEPTTPQRCSRPHALTPSRYSITIGTQSPHPLFYDIACASIGAAWGMFAGTLQSEKIASCGAAWKEASPSGLSETRWQGFFPCPTKRNFP